MTYDLAPQAVVRAPLWPVETLDVLAAPALAAAARSGMTDAEFAALHGQALIGQQQALWRVTLGDARFAAALCLDNPAVHGRLSRWQPNGRRDKRDRQAEQTLYRYLGRAVWRPTPAGLWAGAGLAGWGDADVVRPSPCRTAFAPDLATFAAAFADLARDITAPVKLNPTLTRRGERWILLRPVGRRFTAQILAHQPDIAVVAEVLAGPPRCWENAVSRLSAAGLADAEDRCRAYLDAGILLGGPVFPRRFASVWEALDQAGALLNSPAWTTAVAAARRLCAALDGQGGDLSAAAIAEAHQRLDALLAPLGVSGGRLRCDSGLPFAVTFGAERRACLAAALAEADAVLSAHGLTALAEQQHMRRRLSGDRSSPNGVWQALLAEGDGARRVRLWQECLKADLPLPPADGVAGRGPFGMLALRLGRDGGLEAAGLGSDLTPAFARLGALLGDEAALLRDWCGQRLRQGAGRAGLTPCELLPPPGLVHNGLARPALDGLEVLDPWGAEPGQLPADDLSLGWDELAGRAVVESASVGGLMVHALSPINLGAADPLAERLLFSSGRSLPPFVNEEVTPLADDLTRPGPSPALRTGGGTVVRPGKLFLLGETWAALRHADPAGRFRLWQRLAAEHRLPALVGLSIPGQPQLPLLRDSPLAVEAVLRGADADYAVVTLPEDQSFLSDAQGNHHVTELALPFVRPRSCPAAAPVAAVQCLAGAAGG